MQGSPSYSSYMGHPSLPPSLPPDIHMVNSILLSDGRALHGELSPSQRSLIVQLHRQEERPTYEVFEASSILAGGHLGEESCSWQYCPIDDHAVESYLTQLEEHNRRMILLEEEQIYIQQQFLAHEAESQVFQHQLQRARLLQDYELRRELWMLRMNRYLLLSRGKQKIRWELLDEEIRGMQIRLALTEEEVRRQRIFERQAADAVLRRQARERYLNSPIRKNKRFL